jgi:hypothetical protein
MEKFHEFGEYVAAGARFFLAFSFLLKIPQRYLLTSSCG